jgi:hypothetical protein
MYVVLYLLDKIRLERVVQPRKLCVGRELAEADANDGLVVLALLGTHATIHHFEQAVSNLPILSFFCSLCNPFMFLESRAAVIKIVQVLFVLMLV